MARGDDPLCVRGHNHMQIILNWPWIDKLILDHPRRLGNQCLQITLALLIASPERLIREQQDAVSSVPGKGSDKMSRTRNGQTVLAEYPPQRHRKRALAASLSAPEHQRNFGDLARILNGPSGPPQNVFGSSRITIRQNLINVPPH